MLLFIVFEVYVYAVLFCELESLIMNFDHILLIQSMSEIVNDVLGHTIYNFILTCLICSHN